MLTNIEDTLHKTCLIGLSYFNVQGEPLKQNILAGRVVSVDSEQGITVELLAEKASNSTNKKMPEKKPQFILPTDLSCWFNAPVGEFHTSQSDVKIKNPDYLVTWDIYQVKAQPKDEQAQNNEHQWWQWRPRTQSPNVG